MHVLLPLEPAAASASLGSKLPFAATCSMVLFDEGFSMRATAQGFGVGLTLARVDKPLKEEAVGC